MSKKMMDKRSQCVPGCAYKLWINMIKVHNKHNMEKSFNDLSEKI